MQARRRAGLRSFPEQMSLSSVRSETAFDRIMSRDRRSGVAKSTIVRAQASDGFGEALARRRRLKDGYQCALEMLFAGKLGLLITGGSRSDSCVVTDYA